MRLYRHPTIIVLILFLTQSLLSQNEASKWYFGSYTGLDFMTNPPTITQGSLNAAFGAASIADGSGNLLFYTDGITIWNQNHQLMQNSLNGGMVAGQCPSIIIKQPGNANIFYVFTTNGNPGLSYSTVDMSLAAGLGSVTALNATLVSSLTNVSGNTSFGRLSATKHCNGTDVWVVARDNWWPNGNTESFYSFLVTAAGVSATPVVSAAPIQTVGSTFNYQGTMKISPKGNKIGVSYYWAYDQVANPNLVAHTFELWDFDAMTGVVSNSLALATNTWNNFNNWGAGYGCEFSPDGTKFYGTNPFWTFNGASSGVVCQWNLCAGSPAAIAASQYTLVYSGVANANLHYGMQLAQNGKIYISRFNNNALDVINNPNGLAAACNYSLLSQSTGTNTSWATLPNFMTSYLNFPAPLPPFTYTGSCMTTSFTAPNNPTLSCLATSINTTNIGWNFGDPISGAANTSTLQNPIHIYSAPGTYTAVVSYSTPCTTHTLGLPVVVNGASITVNTSSITCANLGSASVTAQGGTGPFSYTWMPTAQTNSSVAGLQPGNYSITVSDLGANCSYTANVNLAPLVPVTGLVASTSNIPCNGITTGSASVALSGGSGNYSYAWFNGVATQTSPTYSNLPAGAYSLTVIDGLTACVMTQSFVINQPPPLVVNITASSSTVCAGGTISFTAATLGGTPGYTYSWTSGSTTNTETTTQAVAGSYVFSVTSVDANNCSLTKSITVNFVANPTVAVANTSVCLGRNGTLTANGAGTYTWQPTGTIATTLTAAPLATTVYSVVGELLGCTSSITTAIITVLPLPTVTVSSNNNPACQSQSLTLSANNGIAWSWSGPSGFSSTAQNPIRLNLVPINSGVYTVIVTGLNSCTVAAFVSQTVNPTPQLSTWGSTVCEGSLLSLTSIAPPGASYFWNGPLSFTSTLQNPTIANSATTMSGSYSLTVTSVQGCTNDTLADALVFPPPSLTIALSSNSICAQALSGSPNTLTLTSSGANTYTLNTPNHIFNPNPSGPSSPLNLVPPYQPTGPATATLFGSNGVCTVSMTAEFTVVPNPTVSVTNPTPMICVGQSYTYTSAGANSFTWSANTLGSLIYTTGSVAVANPSINSVFSLVGGSLGCYSALQTTSLTVNPLPSIQVNQAEVCIGSAAVLSASGTATSYSWSPSLGLSSTIGSSVMAIPPTNQTYLVIGSLNSCTLAAMTSVSLLLLPVASATVSKPEICLYEQTSLSGSGGLNYDWAGPGNVHLIGQQINFTASNNNQSGNFTLTVTDGKGCRNSTTALVTIKNLPTANLLGKREGCEPFCTQLSLPANSSLTADWYFAQHTSTGSFFSPCFQSPGSYSVFTRLFDGNTSCNNTIVTVVQVNAKPKADFEVYPDHPVEGFDEVLFTNTSESNIISTNWYFINNKGYQSNLPQVRYLFESAGTWPVALVVTNNQGCQDSVVKAILVDADFNIYVPNAFTPNGDDRNDSFFAKGTGITTFELIVFDRWGEKVFQTTEITKGWDGTFRGEECKSDVYIWKLKARHLQGEAKEMTGHVSLYR